MKPAQITEETHEILKRLKEERGLTIAWVIQEAVKEYASKHLHSEDVLKKHLK